VAQHGHLTSTQKIFTSINLGLFLSVFGDSNIPYTFPYFIGKDITTCMFWGREYVAELYMLGTTLER
jgi:hypothetical protein